MSDQKNPSLVAAQDGQGNEVATARWIDLNDVSGAKLKLASIDVAGESVRHIFVTNLSWTNPKWQRCVRDLGFKEAPNRRYLVRRVSDGERITLKAFVRVFPDARIREMAPAEYVLGYGKTSRTSEDGRRVRIDLQGARRLGRNADGDVVYEGLAGRFIVDEESGRRRPEPDHPSPQFLRLSSEHVDLKPGSIDLHEALQPIALGLVRGMQSGEPTHAEHIRTLLEAVFGEHRLQGDAYAAYEEALFDATHEAMLSQMRRTHETPGSAFLEAARLHGYQPNFRGVRTSSAMVPLPLALAAQQLLGDVTDQQVVMPNRWDGALFAFLGGARVRAWQTQAYAGARQRGLSNFFQDMGLVSVDVRETPYMPQDCAGADVLLLNADPRVDEFGQREDLRLASQSLRHLQPGSRALLLLRADDEQHPGRISPESAGFMRDMFSRYEIQDAWEVAPILLRKDGSGPGLRLLLVRAQPPSAQQMERQAAMLEGSLPVMSSWDAVKTHVDEKLQSLQLDGGKRAQRQEERQDDYQRPYNAFSRLGEARTMVPSNLQAPMQHYLTSLESRVGSVDDFVSSQIGMGKATLMHRFSPEQIDGVAIMLSRVMVGRSSILADDTGIGKGRQLAAMAVWANKNGKDVFFVTDRANLFSDLARDLNDIGEWGRFSPLVFNADGEITVDAGPGEAPRVLAQGESPAFIRRLLNEDLSLRDVGRNMVFLTYSQINTEESEKARWLKNHAGDALVIFDEAHIAAGSDSNVATHVAELASCAFAVQFASATWAKSHNNLHIYQRAFPATVSVSTLAETMSKGGDTFSEIFSGMLAMEGAIIRREHDLSRLDVELVVDEANRERNERVSDLVADVLGSAAFLANEMENVFIRTNADSVKALQQARDARLAALPKRVNMFSSNFGSGSVVYQVMKGVQGALNADHVARLCIESLRKGMKPVIVSDATGESLLNKLIEKDVQQPETQTEASFVPMPTLRDLLRDVIVKKLTTVRVREVDVEDILDPQAPPEGEGDGAQLDDDPAVRSQRETEVAVAPNEDDDDIALEEAFTAAQVSDGVKKAIRKARWKEVSIFEHEVFAEEMRAIYQRGIDEIETKIEAIPEIPVNAMDVIEQSIRDAGYRVGEVTGRKHQLVQERDGDEVRWRLQARATNKRAVKASIKAFNDGALDVLLINRSAAAGVSLHASPRFADRSRRHLIEHMIPEDPVNRVQLLGRVNRYDQVSSPLITTASTGIYGEVRYLMMQNRKLARMSANVRSSRDNAMALQGVTDLFNSVGARAIRSYLQDNPLVCKRLGFDAESLEQMQDVVNRVTMRIPLLTVSQQKQVYEEIYSRFNEIIQRAEMEGHHPLRPAEFDVKAKIESQSLFLGDDGQMDEDASSGMYISAFDSPVWAQKLKWEEHLKPLSWDAVRYAAEARREDLLSKGLLSVDPMDEDRVNGDGEEFLVLEAMKKDGHIRIERRGLDDLFDTRSPSQARSWHVMPVLEESISSAMIRGFDGMRRLTRLQSLEESRRSQASQNDGDEQAAANDTVLVKESQSYKRALLVSEWMERNLSKMVPGASISWLPRDADDRNALRPEYIITDVVVPPREHWMHLDQWRITIVAPGEERAREFTLRSLISEVEGELYRGNISGETRVTMFGPVIRDGIYGNRAQRLAHEFDIAPRGKRVRSATVLGGNLYLASEWAAATGKGRAVVYTDDSGARHRGILLPKDLEGIHVDYLPVRLADSKSMEIFLQAIFRPQDHAWLDPETAGDLSARSIHVLDLSFKSAMLRARNSQVGDTVSSMLIVPGEGIGLTMPPSDLRRIAGSIRSAQKAMQAKLGDQADGAEVKIMQFKSRRRMPGSFSRALSAQLRPGSQRSDLGFDDARAAKGTGLLLLRADTPEKLERALDLLTKHAGLEMYVSQSPYRTMARYAIRLAMRQRRMEMSLAQQRLGQFPTQANQTGEGAPSSALGLGSSTLGSTAPNASPERSGPVVSGGKDSDSGGSGFEQESAADETGTMESMRA